MIGKMEIRINRRSVCMGDDVENHSKILHMCKYATYKDLFKRLKREKYFPNVEGNNAVWVLATKEHFCIFAYFTLTQKLCMGLLEKRLRILCKSSTDMFLEYYASPLKWKEKIESEYHHDTYTMWRDGWLDECEYCDYVMSLSQKLQWNGIYYNKNI